MISSDFTSYLYFSVSISAMGISYISILFFLITLLLFLKHQVNFQNTSHNYAHLIERYDYDRFIALTSELIEQNLLGHLSKENLLYIHDILTGFEREYSGSGIIKPEYTRRRVVEHKPFIFLNDEKTPRR